MASPKAFPFEQLAEELRERVHDYVVELEHRSYYVGFVGLNRPSEMKRSPFAPSQVAL